MGKDRRHNKLQPQVHREHLKEMGMVHLPPNKRHKSKKDYKRAAKRVRYVDYESEE